MKKVTVSDIRTEIQLKYNFNVYTIRIGFEGYKIKSTSEY